MKTLEGFCKFMEEYLDEAVYAKGDLSPTERLSFAYRSHRDKAFNAAFNPSNRKDKDKADKTFSANAKAALKIGDIVNNGYSNVSARGEINTGNPPLPKDYSRHKR